MKIDNILLDKLRALESGTMILEMKDGAYEPIGPADILSMWFRWAWLLRERLIANDIDNK